MELVLWGGNCTGFGGGIIGGGDDIVVFWWGWACWVSLRSTQPTCFYLSGMRGIIQQMKRKNFYTHKQRSQIIFSSIYGLGIVIPSFTVTLPDGRGSVMSRCSSNLGRQHPHPACGHLLPEGRREYGECCGLPERNGSSDSAVLHAGYGSWIKNGVAK
jgi:hypothetical protein